MLDENLDTLVTVSDIQIESMYDGRPLNFDILKKTPPSQLVTPVKAYACGIMGWKYDKFIKNINKFGAAYHGGDGNIGYYTLKGFATVDIDNEEDFNLAEAIIDSKNKTNQAPEYFTGGDNLILDSDRERILQKDGVVRNIMSKFNREISSIDNIIRENGETNSWSYTLVNSKSNYVLH